MPDLVRSDWLRSFLYTRSAMERSPEIEAVVRRFWKAFVDQDRQALANMTTDNPDLRAVLSADDEWIKGNGRFEDVMVERAKVMDVVKVEFDRLEGFEHGDAGWFAAIGVVARDTGESLTFRTTGTFIIEAGVWRLTQVHTSRGVPTAETFGYEISKGLARLVGSLDEQAAGRLVSEKEIAFLVRPRVARGRSAGVAGRGGQLQPDCAHGASVERWSCNA